MLCTAAGWQSRAAEMPAPSAVCLGALGLPTGCPAAGTAALLLSGHSGQSVHNKRFSTVHSKRTYIDGAKGTAGTQYLKVSLDTIVIHEMAKMKSRLM